MVLDYIRSKGMIPGLWLELEVMGIKCQVASEVPDEWFFMRHEGMEVNVKCIYPSNENCKYQ